MRRRDLLLAAPAAARPAVPPGGIFLCMHQTTSAAWDLRRAMEGYARAGFTAVEITLPRLQEFARKESPAAARRLLAGLGLRPVSCGSQTGVVEPNPDRTKNLDALQEKCALAQAIGCDRMVMPSATRAAFQEDDYKRAVDNLRAAGDVARPFGVTMMLEFTRTATFCGTLPTALRLVREAAHPNVRVMLDTFHLWGGVSKFEDLDLLQPGELHHLHFEDTPEWPPRELLEQRSRVLPGKGIAPLRRILETLRRKGYRGPASVELFDPEVQKRDPYEVALEVRRTAEAVLQ